MFKEINGMYSHGVKVKSLFGLIFKAC